MSESVLSHKFVYVYMHTYDILCASVLGECMCELVHNCWHLYISAIDRMHACVFAYVVW